MMEKKPKETERLQVVLARHGVASRRGVVTMIEEGLVRVNNAVVREKGFRVVPEKDKIEVEGRELPQAVQQETVYYVFNKPKGVMTTLQDPNAEKTVADFFKEVPERVFPVGRLDRDTTGLLLMTNDGELAFRLAHPKFGVKKNYLALIRGFVADADIKALEKGVDLEEGRTAPCEIRVEERTKKESRLVVVLHEGKKRQIRRIFQKAGYFVQELHRFQYGTLHLGKLRPGEKRLLRQAEVSALKSAVGLKDGRG